MILDLLLQSGILVRRVASTYGGEWAGPCPWCGGRDRFRIWPERGRYWCRGCERSGDAIQFLRDLEGLSFREALDRVQGRLCQRLGQDRATERSGSPLPRPGTRPTSSEAVTRGKVARPAAPSTVAPSPAWQEAGRRFVSACTRELWGPAGTRALSWLKGRGLNEETIRGAGLGYNPEDRFDPPGDWGLPGDHKRIWLPRGIVIPWEVAGELWRVNLRRPAGDPRYIGPAGCGVALYRADALLPGRPVVLLEGELDALTVAQHAGDTGSGPVQALVAAVATGSTAGSRRVQWIARLSLASAVLVAFDADEAGEKAAGWWREQLGAEARRWRPFWEDANAMAQEGADVRSWVIAGLAGRGWEGQTRWQLLAESGLHHNEVKDLAEVLFLSACELIRDTAPDLLPGIWERCASLWQRRMPREAFAVVKQKYQERLAQAQPGAPDASKID